MEVPWVAVVICKQRNPPDRLRQNRPRLEIEWYTSSTSGVNVGLVVFVDDNCAEDPAGRRIKLQDHLVVVKFVIPKWRVTPI